MLHIEHFLVDTGNVSKKGILVPKSAYFDPSNTFVVVLSGFSIKVLTFWFCLEPTGGRGKLAEFFVYKNYS